MVARHGFRRQLLALFGLLLLAGALVLVIDQLAQLRARRSLETLNAQSLGRLRALNAVADGYRRDIVDTTFRVRNYLLDWDAGMAMLERARSRIDDNWQQLQAMPRVPEQQRLFAQTEQARRDADRAVAQLHAILQRRDIAALGRFADQTLYPAVDPVTTGLQALSDLAMAEAQSEIRAEVARGNRDSALRIGLSLVALLVALLVGRRILRNAYIGVETLTWLAQRMRAHDYTAQPDQRPRGELGEVMDVFLGMRGDVLAFETELTDQLVRNERVRAELERRQTLQQSLLDAAQAAIMVLDGEGRWILFNPFAERLLGWRAEEVIGRVVRYGGPPLPDDGPLLLEPAHIEATVARLSAHLGRPVPSDWRAMYAQADLQLPPQEVWLLHKDGHRIPVQMALAAFADENGERAGLVAVATDLSERKRLEHDLRASETRAHEANHAKSAFLASMSHEIRTPMIGVTGMVEVLAHTALEPDQRRALNIIQTSAQSLLQIIGDILDFSKIEAGRLELQPAATALARVVHGAVANFSGAASSKGLTLTCSVDERVAPAYYADALRLRQILGNFLSNAIKFTDSGSVHAALEWRGMDTSSDDGSSSDRLCFRVTDTGIGVGAEAQTRLFQAFAQADGDITRRFGGTGLGLAICRRLATLMGGDVEMESVPGLGTTLRLLVTLPRAPLADVAPEPPALAAAGGFPARALPTLEQAERERSLVLLVDDHPTNRLVIARQLALAGYASQAAENGAQGLEQWRSGRFALLLSDVHMPVMDGYALARAIRAEEAQHALPRTPIVALTASALKGEAERCLDAGMDDYLAKPVGIPVLSATLQRWLPHTAVAATTDAAAATTLGALPQVAHPPPLDPAVLDALTGGDPQQARALLDDFLASTDDDLATLQAAREHGDLPALTRQAHKVKGAARMLGALELADTAAQLEAGGRAADWPTILPLAADLATAAQRLRLYVDARYRR